MAEVVRVYLSGLAARGIKLATLNRRAAAIRWGLADLGRDDEPTRHPSVRKVLAGARRQPGARRQGARPVDSVEVARMVADIDPSTARGRRDRALILVAFAGAFRRSELVAIDVEHVRDEGDRMSIPVPRSKTDQEGEGRYVVLHAGRGATCPVAALRAVLADRSASSGALFVRMRKGHDRGTERITDSGFRLILVDAAERAGLEDVQPHGLRAGHVTEARRRGATSTQVRQTTGHASDVMVSHYTREMDAADNSGRYLGL